MKQETTLRRLAALVLAAVVLAAGNAAAGNDGGNNDNRVQLTMDYRVHLTGASNFVRLVTLVPQDIADKQQVLGLSYSVPPARLFEENGNRYAEFVLINPTADVDIRIDADILLHRYDLSSTAPSAAPQPHPAGEEYLRAEPYLEKDNPAIAWIARGITGNNEMDMIGKLYRYVTGTLTYKGYVPQDVGAAAVLCSLKSGDCSDYADSLVTLARAKNIPARTVDGFLTEYSDNNPRHTWVEIFTESRGWVPFDPLLGSLGQASFDRMPPHYIYLSGTRNDTVLGNYHFFACTYTGAPVAITDTYSVRKNTKDIVTLTQR